MASDYVVPLSITKRVRFYDGQFLQDQDLIDEQKYHVGRQDQQQRSIHVSGVLDGLGVYQPEGQDRAFKVRVRKGSAVDAEGRLIILSNRATVQLPEAAGTSYLYIAYGLVAADPQSSDKGVRATTRWLDDPKVFTSPSILGAGDDYTDQDDWNDYLPAAPSPVMLARLTTDDQGNVAVADGERVNAGVRLPGPGAELVDPLLRTDADGNVGLHQPGGGTFHERLTITPAGDLAVNHGALTVTAGDANLGRGLSMTAGDWEATENEDRALRFSSKGTEPGDPEVAHPAGRIHGDAIGGWNGQSLVLQAATGWTGYVDKHLVLTGDGNVGIGTDRPEARLQILGGTDAGLIGGGSLTIGALSSTNLGFDTDEIMARNNGVASNLHLNHDGGEVYVGAAFEGVDGNTVRLKVAGRLEFTNGNWGGFWTGNDRFVGARASTQVGVWNGGAWRLLVDDVGNVGINTLSPSTKLEIGGGNNSTVQFKLGGRMEFTNGDFGGFWLINDRFVGARGGDQVGIWIDGDWRFGVHSEWVTLRHGYLYLENGDLRTHGGIRAPSDLDLRAGSTELKIGTNGSIYGNFVDTSDQAFKSDIDELDSSLTTVGRLRPRSFRWIQSGLADAGFVAQEVEPVAPDLVHVNDEGTRFLNYNGIIALAVGAIKEQQEQIESLEARLQLVEGEGSVSS